MVRQLPVWGPPQYALDQSKSSVEKIDREYVKKCVDSGVTKLIPGGGSKNLVDEAHENGLLVEPYNAFPGHGGLNIEYQQWSTIYPSPGIEAPESRPLLDKHRPIYAGPFASLKISEFAQKHPEYWSRKKNTPDEMFPGQILWLSLAHEAVREYEIQIYLDMLEETGGDGIQVEFVRGNEDEHGVGIYGYEDKMVNGFINKFGKDPRTIGSDDSDWIQHRADYTTLFLSELRQKIKESNSAAVVSTTLIAQESDEYIKLFHDWPSWLDQGLVDEFYLWFRTNSDLNDLAKHMSHVANINSDRVPLIAELSCYHPGSFQESDALLEAAKVALDNGADAVGVYRSHAVEQLNLWKTIENISKL